MNPIERAARHVDAWQQRHGAVAFVLGVMKKFGDDNAGSLVNNLAYSAFLALFPLLLVGITVLGIVLDRHPRALRAVDGSIAVQFPIIGPDLLHNVHALHRQSMASLVVGLVGLAWGGLGVSQAGIFAMEQVWNVPGTYRPNYWVRLVRSLLFVLVLGSGVLLTTFLAGFGTFGRHSLALGLGGEALSALINLLQYVAAFRVLTPKGVPTRRLVPGAVVGALAWTALQATGGYLVGHDLRNDSALYGTFAVVLGMVAWIYLGVRVSVYAAELNVVLAWRLWPRGLVQPPLTPADQISMTVQASENERRPEQRVDVRFTDEPELGSGVDRRAHG